MSVCVYEVLFSGKVSFPLYLHIVGCGHQSFRRAQSLLVPNTFRLNEAPLLQPGMKTRIAEGRNF